MILPRGRVIWTFFTILTLCCDTTKHKRQSYKTKYRQLQREYRNISKELQQLSKRLDKLEERQKEAATCPAGFVRFYRRCLWFVLEPRKNWTDARLHCLNYSSHLFVDNSTRKHEFIKKFLKYNSPHASNSDIYTAGIFGCIGDHTPLLWDPGSTRKCTTFQEWHWDNDGQQVSTTKGKIHWVEDHPPHRTANESGLGYSKVSCLRFSRDPAMYGKWMAANCKEKLPFICELRLPMFTKTKTVRRKNKYRYTEL